MLFDLRGKRRRVIQVVYLLLAVLFLVGFVGFGVGSSGSGGIFDALGIGGDSGGSSSPQYQQQIDDAESRLETDPKNTTALLNLARYHFLSATSTGVSRSDTGATEITEDAHNELEDSVEAWARYLKTDPKHPNESVATNVVQAYVLLNDAEGAAKTQQIVAEAHPSVAAYGSLAYYLYADGQIKAGDEAADKAIAEADPSQRKQLEEQMNQLGEAARKQKKQLAKLPEGGATGGGSEIENPFGGLQGAGGATPAP
jgi:hypothetical protein